MKKITAIISFLFFIQIVAAQKNFEGIINYYTKQDFFGEKKVDTMIAFFGKKKIRVDNKIFDFETGFTYSISDETKTIWKEKMIDQIPDTFSFWRPVLNGNKIILGYHCSLYEQNFPREDTTDGIKTFLRYADSLYYSIPDKYICVAKIPLLTNGNKIGLGVEIIFRMGNTEQIVTTTNPFIKEQQLPDSIFAIPSNYNIENIERINDSSIADSSFVPIKIGNTKKNPKLNEPLINYKKKKSLCYLKSKKVTLLNPLTLNPQNPPQQSQKSNIHYYKKTLVS